MRDALTPQQRNLFPDAAQQLVAPRLRDPIERGTFDRFVREEQPVGLDGRDGPQVGRADTDVARLEREQGLVLDRPAQRGERPFVPDVLQDEVAVDAEQEVGVPFVPAEHLDEQALLPTRSCRTTASNPRVDGSRLEPAERSTRCARARPQPAGRWTDASARRTPAARRRRRPNRSTLRGSGRRAPRCPRRCGSRRPRRRSPRRRGASADRRRRRRRPRAPLRSRRRRNWGTGADDPGVAVPRRDECGRTGQIEDLLQTPGESAATLPATADTSTARGRRTTMNATASTIGYRSATNCDIPTRKRSNGSGRSPKKRRRSVSKPSSAPLSAIATSSPKRNTNAAAASDSSWTGDRSCDGQFGSTMAIASSGASQVCRT